MPVLTGEAEYPENALDVLKETVGDVRIIKASEKALELGNIKAQNICLLGALIKVLGIDGIDWVKLVEESVPAKVKDINVEAFKAGFNMI